MGKRFGSRDRRRNHKGGCECDERVWFYIADASVKDKDGKTAWDLAQDNEKLKGTDAYWMLVLLDAGADVNARDKDGRTALMRAASGGTAYGTAESVKLLLDAGVDVNARYENGWTVLMFAASGGAAENVKVLLDAGVDASVKDTLGKTAWDLAQENEALKGTDAYWMLNDARFK